MTKPKTVHYEVAKEERWWIVSVPSLGLVTQSRQLGDTEVKARSVAALHLSVDVESIDMVRDRVVGLPPRVSQAVNDAADLRLRHEALARDAARMTQLAAKALLMEGVTLRDAGQLLGLSHQRVAQIVGESSSDVHRARMNKETRKSMQAVSVRFVSESERQRARTVFAALSLANGIARSKQRERGRGVR